MVTGSIVNLTYGYDANGNITSIVDTVNPLGGEIFENPGTYTYQQGTNKLTHIEGTPSIDFGYDANANITSKTGWTYIYDLSNQLIIVLSGGNQVAEYTYNGAGQRIKKVTQTETRIFHYDLLGHLIAETNQSGQMLAEYIYIGDQLLSVIKPGESVYYYHNDHLGTPQVLTNNSQTIAWKAVYTPFGEAVPSIQTVENPFRFPGQYHDQETGLHYNYFRYYNPQTGRYVTPDPIGLEGGINLFAYAKNNPAKFIDPYGRIAIADDIAYALLAAGVYTWTVAYINSPAGQELIRNMARNLEWIWDISFASKPGSKPKGCPTGTKPINKYPELTKDDIHKIKKGVGAGPRDWVGITPEGDVITGDSSGKAVNQGPFKDYLP
jgi:RHS repeat-associated protein